MKPDAVATRPDIAVVVNVTEAVFIQPFPSGIVVTDRNARCESNVDNGDDIITVVQPVECCSCHSPRYRTDDVCIVPVLVRCTTR